MAHLAAEPVEMHGDALQEGVKLLLGNLQLGLIAAAEGNVQGKICLPGRAIPSLFKVGAGPSTDAELAVLGGDGAHVAAAAADDAGDQVKVLVLVPVTLEDELAGCSASAIFPCMGLCSLPDTRAWRHHRSLERPVPAGWSGQDPTELHKQRCPPTHLAAKQACLRCLLIERAVAQGQEGGSDAQRQQLSLAGILHQQREPRATLA